MALIRRIQDDVFRKEGKKSKTRAEILTKELNHMIETRQWTWAHIKSDSRIELGDSKEMDPSVEMGRYLHLKVELEFIKEAKGFNGFITSMRAQKSTYKTEAFNHMQYIDGEIKKNENLLAQLSAKQQELSEISLTAGDQNKDLKSDGIGELQSKINQITKAIQKLQSDRAELLDLEKNMDYCCNNLGSLLQGNPQSISDETLVLLTTLHDTFNKLRPIILSDNLQVLQEPHERWINNLFSDSLQEIAYIKKIALWQKKEAYGKYPYPFVDEKSEYAIQLRTSVNEILTEAINRYVHDNPKKSIEDQAKEIAEIPAFQVMGIEDEKNQFKTYDEKIVESIKEYLNAMKKNPKSAYTVYEHPFSNDIDLNKLALLVPMPTEGPPADSKKLHPSPSVHDSRLRGRASSSQATPSASPAAPTGLLAKVKSIRIGRSMRNLETDTKNYLEMGNLRELTSPAQAFRAGFIAGAQPNPTEPKENLSNMVNPEFRPAFEEGYKEGKNVEPDAKLEDVLTSSIKKYRSEFLQASREKAAEAAEKNIRGALLDFDKNSQTYNKSGFEYVEEYFKKEYLKNKIRQYKIKDTVSDDDMEEFRKNNLVLYTRWENDGKDFKKFKEENVSLKRDANNSYIDFLDDDKNADKRPLAWRPKERRMQSSSRLATSDSNSSSTRVIDTLTERKDTSHRIRKEKRATGGHLSSVAEIPGALNSDGQSKKKQSLHIASPTKAPSPKSPVGDNLSQEEIFQITKQESRKNKQEEPDHHSTDISSDATKLASKQNRLGPVSTPLSTSSSSSDRGDNKDSVQLPNQVPRQHRH